MEYLLFALVLAALLTGWLALRNRSAGDTRKSVESFRKAMRALEPRGKGRSRRR